MVSKTAVIHLEISGEHVFNRLQDLHEEQLTPCHLRFLGNRNTN